MMEKKATKTMKLQKKTLDLIEMAKGILQDNPMDLREIYYEAEAKQLIIASFKVYTQLKNALIKARKLLLIDPGLIETPYDRRPMTNPPEGYSAKKAVQFLRRIHRLYQKNFWEDQENYIEVWVEKISLCKYFAPICRKYGVILIPCKGDQAISAIWEAKQRFDEKLTKDKKVKVLYFGDFNPSGVHAPIAIKKTLEDWGTTGVEFKRIALLFEDISKYNLPPNPTKKTTKKDRTLAERFIEKYGADYNVELDSLKAHAMDEFLYRIEDSINSEIDFKKQAKTYGNIVKVRERLKKIVDEQLREGFPYLFSDSE